MKRWTMHSHGMDAVDAVNVDDPKDYFMLTYGEEVFVLDKDYATLAGKLDKALAHNVRLVAALNTLLHNNGSYAANQEARELTADLRSLPQAVAK